MNLMNKNENYNFDDPKLVSIIDDLPFWSAPFGMKLLDKINVARNLKVLDIGSGLGFPIIEMANRLGPTSKIFGIDPWNAGLDRVREKIKIQELTNVELFNIQAESLPFEDNYFDLIVSNNGTNNVHDEFTVFEECARVARTKAQLVITVNLNRSMIEFYEVFVDVLKTNGLTNLVPQVEKHIYSKRKPVEETIAMIEDAGFSLNEVDNDQFQYRYCDGTSFLQSFLVRLAFKDSWLKIIENENHVEIFEQVEEKLNKKAETEGLLKLSIPFVTLEFYKN